MADFPERPHVRHHTPAIGEKLRAADKVRHAESNLIASDQALRKPAWIRARIPSGANVQRVRAILRERKLATVCEEANCPNLGECFNGGTATFMIMGDICTRRCPFCDVAHGRPKPLDAAEPYQLAEAIAELGLRYVVITSVDRDDLDDGGAAHFAACIREARALNPSIVVETLVPDFRGQLEVATQILAASPPDIFNHNMETVPRLYKAVRPGANYSHSLQLMRRFAELAPGVPTKSGLMLGLGESMDEVVGVLRDLRSHGVAMLTLGQYLQPSKAHLPVQRFVSPEEFSDLAGIARELGFSQIASGPMVRSSYHADLQAQGHQIGQ
ncbi:MAG TPA: lipoyl synthase [Pseudomonadales bacterium]|nr:lipoyl synthase [Pseudomonadales bacterium]